MNHAVTKMYHVSQIMHHVSWYVQWVSLYHKSFITLPPVLLCQPIWLLSCSAVAPYLHKRENQIWDTAARSWMKIQNGTAHLLRKGSSSQTEEPARSDRANAKKLCWKFPDKSLKANMNTSWFKDYILFYFHTREDNPRIGLNFRETFINKKKSSSKER